ncbi:MAG: M1 family metallopeptidase [Bacteroidales bacterium]|nr:M1 family metallopeptidase [Bacteroidales bacterium]
MHIILAFFLLSGCAVMRVPDFARVPDKPGTYPRFTQGDTLIGRLDEDRAGYDVFFYDLDLVLDPARKSLGGTVNIHFKAISGLSAIRIDLYENLRITGMKLSGEDVPWRRNERAVYVSPPHLLMPGHDYILAVEYEGKPTRAKNPPWGGGVVWKTDVNGNPWIGVACETEGGSLWFPCKDHLSDEPDSVMLRMTVPAGLQVVSNGLMQSHTSRNNKETYIWLTRYPVNIYNITFYAGKYEHFSDTMITPYGNLDLDYYVMPLNLDRAKKHFLQVKDIIGLYSRLYGPYPWIGEVFRLVESPYEGMEHQTAIAYGSGYSNRGWLGGDYIIVHEAAHEWWGNALSISDFSDIWLHEGFATYTEMLFAESTLGYANSLLYARYNIAASIRNRFPVVGPAGVSYWNDRDNDVYNKGAMILHTIRNVVSDSTLFFDILQTFYSEHAAASHATTEDFIRIVEDKTGKDWHDFFEVYLYRREVPVLQWYYSPAGIEGAAGSPNGNQGPVIAAKWTGVPDGFTMPVDLFCKEQNVTIRIEVSDELLHSFMMRR